MKHYRLWIVIGCLSLLAPLGASQENEPVIQVSCTETFGCFRLVGQAIERAPEGAIIQVGYGVYYEFPFVIDKSLTIQGISLQTQSFSLPPVISSVQPGALITIRSSDHPIAVDLENLRLQNLQSFVSGVSAEQGGPVGIGVNIQAPAEGNPEQLKVLLRDSEVSAMLIAVRVSGKAQLTLQGNTIRSQEDLVAGGSRLIVEENRFFTITDFGTPTGPVMFLSGVDARFQKNIIAPLPRQKVLGIGALGGQYSFIENQISGSAIGVTLGGKTTADFRGNVFRENIVGIVLEVPPCIQNPAEAPELQFQGFITGADNQFAYNSKADLCPALGEYPWPPGFLKKP